MYGYEYIYIYTYTYAGGTMLQVEFPEKLALLAPRERLQWMWFKVPLAGGRPVGFSRGVA